MKPPFSYYGGKQRLASKIVKLIPKHTNFVEPFCGGAAVYFAKPPAIPSNKTYYREVLNDTNKMIYTFFKVLRDQGHDLKKMIDYALYSQWEYQLSKQLCYSEDEIEMAYYFYINIQQSFVNGFNKGWGTAKFAANHALVSKNKKESIPNAIDRLQSTYISCEDALTCIKRWDSPQTFFYCDPPYPNTNQGHYNGYTQSDFEKLIETLDQCEGSFLLSCYPNDAVPNDWEKFEFETKNSSSNTAKGGHRDLRTECVWRRMAKGTPRKEIEKIYQMDFLKEYV
ncbi:MAG: DNA adenine methylase [Ignavibacteria bacterium]|jgi:DNA adenine methylase